MKGARSCMLVLVLLGLWILPVGCSGGGGSTSTTSPTSSPFFDWGLPFFYGSNVYTSITPDGNGSYYAFSPYTTEPSGTNVQPITVNGGPEGIPNLAFTSVTVCVPSSPTTCQTIDNVLVDTGSVGLRLLRSALTLSLPSEQINGNNLGECVQFGDLSYVWGSIQTAIVELAGETTVNQVPIHVLDPDFPKTDYTPSDCKRGMTTGEENTLQSLGANGILGIGSTQYDCSVGGINLCDGAKPQPATYYTCTSSVCTNTTLNPLQQVQNPVALFTSTGDNNGIIIEFPPISDPAVNLTGWLIFGISTQPTLKFDLDSTGLIYTNFNASTHIPSFFDSGSNGYFFPDKSIHKCSTASIADGFYCTSGTTTDTTSLDLISLTATITDYLGNISPVVDFSVGDAYYMFYAYPTYAVFNTLAGPSL